MTGIDLIGWATASFTLLAFTSRNVRTLRLASLGASVAFVTFGAATSTWPVLALHAVLLPINLMRLIELHRATCPKCEAQRPDLASLPGSPAPTPAPTGTGLQRLMAVRRYLQRVLARAPLVLGLACTVLPASSTPKYEDRMHARAVDSFRQGRFPEAYGRFIDLANLGHPASARYALWMCEQGLPLFGRDWDCAPHEIEAWARAAAPIVNRRSRQPAAAATAAG